MSNFNTVTQLNDMKLFIPAVERAVKNQQGCLFTFLLKIYRVMAVLRSLVSQQKVVKKAVKID